MLYLPLLLATRMMIARSLPPESEESWAEEAPWRCSVVLATGAVLLSLPVGELSAVAVVIEAA